VVLAGQPGEGLLAAVGRFMNVSLVRPDAHDDSKSGIETAAGALRRAAGISSPYVMVAADPLASVAAEWQAMWAIPHEPRGSAPAGGRATASAGSGFEVRAGEALASWRARQFELPDYYLVLASAQQGAARQGAARQGAAAPLAARQPAHAPRPDFYLGPLRALRPHRVAVVAASETAEQATEVLTVLGSLRHGRWWPPLPEVIDAARRFYPGALSPVPDGSPVPLLN
jgi:hypothetical protein